MRLTRRSRQAWQLLGHRGRLVHQEHRVPRAVALRQVQPLAAAWSLEQPELLPVAVLRQERHLGMHLLALPEVVPLAGSEVQALLARRERLAQRWVQALPPVA